MTINQLTNKTSFLEEDFLLISEGSIDYKCTVKELILNSLKDFKNLTLGSESNYVNGIFTNGLHAAGTIDFKGNPNFNTTLGSSARPIWINNYPEAITASDTQTVLACTGVDKTNNDSYSWLKYSANDVADTLVLRTGDGGINAKTFNGYTLDGSGNNGIPTSASVNNAITSAKAEAITASKVTNTPKTKADANNNIKYYLLGVTANNSGQVQNTFTYDNLFITVKSDGAWLTADYVVNAVWNDIADYLSVDEDLEVIYGRAYIRDPKTNKVRLAQKNERAIGLASDTCGFQLGKNDKEHQIPIALGGWILAYTDKNYKPGTLLKIGKKGILTKASKLDEIFNPSRIIASFDRVEKEETWHGKVVDGRNWVKIK